MSSEMELLSKLYLELIEYTPDNDSKVLDSILEDIEYHIHKYDNAVYFADLGGIDRVVQILNQSSDTKLISKAAICLGAAAQRLVKPALSGPPNVSLYQAFRSIQLLPIMLFHNNNPST